MLCRMERRMNESPSSHLLGYHTVQQVRYDTCFASLVCALTHAHVALSRTATSVGARSWSPEACCLWDLMRCDLLLGKIFVSRAFFGYLDVCNQTQRIEMHRFSYRRQFSLLIILTSLLASGVIGCCHNDVYTRTTHESV